MNQPVRKVDPLVFRQQLLEFRFDLLRRIPPGQPQQAGDAFHMRIDHHTAGDPMPGPE
jgi:hypothetical protein